MNSSFSVGDCVIIMMDGQMQTEQTVRLLNFRMRFLRVMVIGLLAKGTFSRNYSPEVDS